MHLATIILIALAIALITTLAAYRRQVEPSSASHFFVLLASRLIAAEAFLRDELEACEAISGYIMLSTAERKRSPPRCLIRGHVAAAQNQPKLATATYSPGYEEFGVRSSF